MSRLSPQMNLAIVTSSSSSRPTRMSRVSISWMLSLTVLEPCVSFLRFFEEFTVIVIRHKPFPRVCGQLRPGVDKSLIVVVSSGA
ncbi:unnamed protein product [Cochlearia groenlandica]